MKIFKMGKFLKFVTNDAVASTMLKREFEEETKSPDLSNDSSPMNTFGHD
jgi:hypothetical protein